VQVVLQVVHLVLRDRQMDSPPREPHATAGEALARQLWLAALVADEVDAFRRQPLEQLAVVTAYDESS
jgi:hypothetical protein